MTFYLFYSEGNFGFRFPAYRVVVCYLRDAKFEAWAAVFFAITPFFKGLWYNNSTFDVVKTKNMCNFA